MESSTSKLAANVLIVTSILLITTSLAITLTKKTVVVTPLVTKNTNQEVTQPSQVTEVLSIASTTTSTTTEVTSIATSTIATTTQGLSTLGFTERKWIWVKTSGKDGKVVTPKKAIAFSVTLKDDRSLLGTTDCNTFFGNFQTTNKEISFTKIGSTKMFCENSQEQLFINSIQNVIEYTFDKASSSLMLTTASGTMVFK